MTKQFDADALLNCYRRGVFPMGQGRDSNVIDIIDPDMRGILPLEAFHIPRSLKKIIRREPFEIRIDTCFTRVMEACAETFDGRDETWINDWIINLYSTLHRRGNAHSVECWHDGQLVGGLYGVSIGGAFFGESMFSRQSNASRIALVYLVARLIQGGFTLLDAQFHNPHLEQFGLIEIDRGAFHARLKQALTHAGNFYSDGSAGVSSVAGSEAIQRITQIS